MESKTHKITFELDEYFNGKRYDFSCSYDVPGLSAFARKVLNEMRKVKYGSTITYSELAKRIGTRAVQAVGSALAKNPIPIIIPCHRVVAKNGIGGYSAGIDFKIQLLEFEQKTLMGDNL
ncbi:MAG: methylated-DNA--[protein]-cysteine S-methyltransferase [Candidatus Methanoperedens sp.]|nr:methylated-DNA--[protein]-cysteine S-methyltransferase [Candidatus Methanoperedens sp.]MCE8426464.1 methylated-DNA--[protein]-cysteine S-methyltransferase [Candidatus Methanoperedens sp.]